MNQKRTSKNKKCALPRTAPIHFLTLFIFLFVGGILHASETKKDCKNESIHDCLEYVISELQKSVEINIKYSKLENAPKWDGKDFSTLPVSMPQAVAKAKDCLKKWGCNSDK